MLVQLTGLSGSGKTTLSVYVKEMLEKEGLEVEILDGDVCRTTISKDLGFTKEDRLENIRRLGALGYSRSLQHPVVIIAAINPYEEARKELTQMYGAKTIWISCDLNTLVKRDPKGLYRLALLPDDHPEKLRHFTGISDVYEEPLHADLVVDTAELSQTAASARLLHFIRQHLG